MRTRHYIFLAMALAAFSSTALAQNLEVVTTFRGAANSSPAQVQGFLALTYVGGAPSEPPEKKFRVGFAMPGAAILPLQGTWMVEPIAEKGRPFGVTPSIFGGPPILVGRWGQPSLLLDIGAGSLALQKQTPIGYVSSRIADTYGRWC